MPRRHEPLKHQRFESSAPCQRKRRFASEQEALAAIERTLDMNISLNLKTYVCPYCSGWHLSSIKED